MPKRLRPRITLAAELLEARANPASFSTLTDYWVGSNVLCVDAGDINGDGYADIIAGTGDNSHVNVLINDGTGQFVSGENVHIGAPFFVKLADLNADGKLDMVAGNSYGQQILAALGNGDGTFQTPVARDAGTTVQGVAAADFNGDGLLDTVAALPTGAAVYMNDGTANVFAAPTFYNTGTDSSSVITGDFNGDGKVDFAIAGYGSNRVDVFLNNGDGTFNAPTQYLNPGPLHSTAVRTGDFDNNGTLDLVVGLAYSSQFGLLRGNGDGTFQATELINAGQSDNIVEAVGDFNLDGNLDLVVMQGGYGRESVLLGDGTGGFAAPSAVISAWPGHAAVGDVNGDGVPDIVTGHALSPGLVSVSINTTVQVLSSFTVTAPTEATVGESFTITVIANDQFGNTLDNYTGTLQFTSTDSLAGLPADYTFTPGDNGTATFTVTLNSVGSWTITAADSTANVEGTSGPVDTRPPLVLSSVTVAAPEFVTIGESFTITVTANDQHGDIFTGYAGTVHFTSTDELAGLPADYTFTPGDNGTATFTVTLYSVGNWTIAATDIDTGITGTSNSIAALPEAPGSLIDRGPNGLWLSSEEGEVRISALNAQSAAIAADGETVVADFGRRGLWWWSNTDGWDKLAGANVEKVRLSADGEAVVADFGRGGLRRWSETDGWDKLTWANAQSYSISADGTTVVADFGYLGLWRWTETANWWTRITWANVESVALSADGNTIVADFGWGGLRKWSAGQWVALSRANVKHVAISADGETVVADFGWGGVRTWSTTTNGWAPLSRPNVRNAAATPGTTSTFVASGAWSSGDNWSLLNWLDDEGIWVG